jgi:hypothetical protein
MFKNILRCIRYFEVHINSYLDMTYISNTVSWNMKITPWRQTNWNMNTVDNGPFPALLSIVHIPYVILMHTTYKYHIPYECINWHALLRTTVVRTIYSSTLEYKRHTVVRMSVRYEYEHMSYIHTAYNVPCSNRYMNYIVRQMIQILRVHL